MRLPLILAVLCLQPCINAYADAPKVVLNTWGTQDVLYERYPRPENEPLWLGSGLETHISDDGVLFVAGASLPKERGWFRLYSNHRFSLVDGFSWEVELRFRAYQPDGKAQEWHSMLAFMALQYDPALRGDRKKAKYAGIDPDNVCYIDTRITGSTAFLCKSDGEYRSDLYDSSVETFAELPEGKWIRLRASFRQCEDRLAARLEIDENLDGMPEKIESGDLPLILHETVMTGLRADFVDIELRKPRLAIGTMHELCE